MTWALIIIIIVVVVIIIIIIIIIIGPPFYTLAVVFHGAVSSSLSGLRVCATTTVASRVQPDDLTRSLISGFVMLIHYICTPAESLS